MRLRKNTSCGSLDPFTFAPVGGESGVAVLGPAPVIPREIVVAHEGQSVLVVSHKATLRLLLCSLVGSDARGYRDRLDQSPVLPRTSWSSRTPCGPA